MIKKNITLGPLSNPLVLIGAGVAILFGRLALVPDLSASIPLVVGISGIIVILLALGQYWGTHGKRAESPIFIITMAALFRIMFLWQPPVLSDDIYRYLFDGLMMIQGNNPYAIAPLDAQNIGPVMKALVPLINHNHIPTIYPPGAQVVFAAGAALGSVTGPVLGMKLMLFSMDMGTCVLILILLRTLGRPLYPLILYAWNPLPVLEIAGSGHIDGAALLFFLASLVLSIQNRSSFLCGLFMGFSVVTKWVPLIFFPTWLLMVGKERRLTALLSFSITILALSLPFFPEMINGFVTLGNYLRHWEFSGFIFRSIRELTGSGMVSRLLVATVFAGIIGTLFIRQSATKRSSEDAMIFLLIISSAYLVLSPTVYPWYAIYLAGFLPFTPTPGGLVFTWSLMLSYGVLITLAATGQWAENGMTSLMIISAPGAAVLATTLLGMLKRTPQR
ncbi:hypothetical protein HRM2_13880 [Desulforapulum autotrophicum HRM2]|uniref:DUF2029 domain-containing protein n=1 Tax=Desulforapulum autotrophicum (strain ATCC 43914 / DSM 3382 / VKM B-1955 / HRM2) TaxID=177437 RepID=C0Q907_DESAH|nr:hypothetical protein [Desulforapulum autotrophicum]ACN14497.1 hypothetical protein HRM2_13880 [Desulforapulum autotrophicum HRM2]